MSVIAIAGLFATQGTINLQYQPKIGSSYKSAMTMAQSSQMGNTTTTMTVAVKVAGFENGYYKLLSSTSNVKVTGGMGNAGQMKKAMEKTTTLYVDKHFKPKMDNANQAPDMQKMMSGMNSAFSGVTFPSKPVKIGDSWTNTIDMGALMSAATKGQKATQGMKSNGKVNLTYKLLKADAGSVTIGLSINGTVNMSMAGGNGVPGGPQGMKMSMSMSGGGTSSMERATGTPLNSSTKINMQMSFAGQPMNIVQSVTTKRI
jgi:hypothetical protein